MRLRADIKLTDFLSKVNECAQDVYFVTGSGDRLNLKSLLSRYVFLTVQQHPEILESSTVECGSEQDTQLLRDFLVQA